jgi:Cytochrome P460
VRAVIQNQPRDIPRAKADVSWQPADLSRLQVEASNWREPETPVTARTAIAAHRKDGHFPDGTVLVKEVFKTTTKDMTTGTVSSAGTLAGWFVMVKDNVGRFSGNKLWGDGWGWSWFDATNPQKTTSTDYTTDCQSCHVPARQSDWIYTHGYPVLTR